MNYTLPETVEIGGAEYPIRWDYRPILDICAALQDTELDNQERAIAALTIFYPDFEDIPVEHVQEALDKLFWFINCGEEDEPKQGNPKLVDWEQDFRLIAAPVSRVLGRSVRSKESLHWWDWMDAYAEIGDCTFAQVVSIRDKRARGKKLDKQDQEWYRRNRHLVDFKTKYSSNDISMLESLTGFKAK